MWILKGPNDKCYYLLPGKHVVGRKNCDLVFGSDQSISRTHAIIEVTHPQSNWGNPEKKPVVELKDAGSKYGTTLTTGSNTTKVEENVTKNLKENDMIHFGVQFNKWLNYKPLIVVISSLPKAEKQKVQTIIGELGGFVVNEWHPQTSHLTMANFTMTVKAINALALAKHIVTPQYWISLKTAIASKGNIPKCEDYVPPIGETVLNEHNVSFLANPKRKSLFSGKTFYFFSEPQFKDHGCMVQAAGGAAKLVRAVRHSQMKNFMEPDAVAMLLLSINSQSLTLSQTPEVYTEVCASEIGLAVLHCSVEKYCNPDFSFSSMLLRNSKDSQPIVPEKILATETQENSEPSQCLIGERKIIPDSGCESKLGLSLTEDRISGAPDSQDTENIFEGQETQSAELKSKSSQIRSQVQSQQQGAINRNIIARNSKRLRVIDESDDEVEVLTPRKIPAGPANAKQRNPVVVTVDESSSDVEDSFNISSTSCSSRVSRWNTSKTLNHNEDSDDPDALFADFKESRPKARKYTNLKRPESPDVDADELFADFQEDVKPSGLHKFGGSNKSVRPSVTSIEPKSPACKRDFPSDDETEPPEKRFAKLDVSRHHETVPHLEEETNNEEDFMSTSQVKKEDESLDVKPSCNVTVVFKPLLITNSKNSSLASEEVSLDCTGVVNYKKFKKVNPLSTSVLPHIIGGRDLQPYQSFCGNSSVFSGMNDHAEESDDEEGPNTLWGSVTQRNNSKFNRSRKL
ncbi:Uncharacterized protein GBIM_05321 [Gryllus bimaculatus]|nr:Uncharacterized protein GBIM_05321 [Gryllus bimaculatus]